MKNSVWYLPKFQEPAGTLPESNKILQDVGETILDFTPIVGDIKGMTIDPYRAYKEDGWKGGLTMLGLGLLGLIPFVGDAAKVSSKVGKIIKKSYIKPWKSNPEKVNKAVSYALESKPNQRFELVKDQEPGYYSVHFKTDRGALNEEEKQALIQAIYDNLPEGAKLSTWGEVSKGGFSGIDRFRTQTGMILTDEMRTVGVKTSSNADDVANKFGYIKNADGTISFPILQKQTRTPGNTGLLTKRLDKSTIKKLNLPETIDGISLREKLESVPIEIGNAKHKGGAYFSALDNKIIVGPDLPKEMYDEVIDHERIHALDWLVKNNTERYSEDVPIVLGARGLYQKEFGDSNVFTSELAAKLAQLKYKAGIDKNIFIPGEKWKEWIDNYSETTDPKYNFISGLKTIIKDWDKLAKWADKAVPAVTPIILPKFIWNGDDNKKMNDAN